MKRRTLIFSLALIICLQHAACGQYQPHDKQNYATDALHTIEIFNSLLSTDRKERKESLKYLEDYWDDGYTPMLLDMVYLTSQRVDYKAIIRLLEKKTGEQHGVDIQAWLEWMWNTDQKILPYHGEWMAEIYKKIDPKFEKYFKDRTATSLIRLDEVRWGGVHQDGIPPLRQPKMIDVSRAKYLDDNDIVFGVSINGDHRAYPKRILAWHEMFVDVIGGESIAGVYCTLCGTVIAYNTKFNGTNHALGTSGFLYRSNKLMYDRATQSLWNTIEGKPVIGPLAGSDIELNSHAVVTTTWGAWKALHPETQVLSLSTGHRRDYDEGVAYEDYFATDDLMFNVPVLDNRLYNKDEVLIVRADGYQNHPLAISADFLAEHPVYHDKINDTEFVVVTDHSGGNRVYGSKGHTFKEVADQSLKDSNGQLWQITEERLTAADGTVLERLPYHRMFWFAWFNTYRDTRLVF